MKYTYIILLWIGILLISWCTSNTNSINKSDYKTTNNNCTIKGNISYKGNEKIYHLPSCENYSDTVINTDYGERWFCSEQEAVSAWWRKASNC